jgi:hypothetical protein
MQYLHKESVAKNYLDKLLRQKLALSEKNIKKIILSTPIIKKIQSEIKSVTGFKVSEEHTKEIVQSYLKC